jgi:hypothetical protein
VSEGCCAWTRVTELRLTRGPQGLPVGVGAPRRLSRLGESRRAGALAESAVATDICTQWPVIAIPPRDVKGLPKAEFNRSSIPLAQRVLAAYFDKNIAAKKNALL